MHIWKADKSCSLCPSPLILLLPPACSAQIRNPASTLRALRGSAALRPIPPALTAATTPPRQPRTRSLLTAARRAPSPGSCGSARRGAALLRRAGAGGGQTLHGLLHQQAGSRQPRRCAARTLSRQRARVFHNAPLRGEAEPLCTAAPRQSSAASRSRRRLQPYPRSRWL